MEQAQHEHDGAEELLPVHDEPEADDEESVLSDEREPQGVADAEDVLLAQLEDLSDDGGLDVEAGVIGGIDPSALVDADDDSQDEDESEPRAGLEDASFGIDAAGDEDGLLKDSEGDSELYQSEFADDEPDGHGDDGGLEGIESAQGREDPLHDGLDEGALPPIVADEAEDAVIEEIEQELIREIGRLGSRG